VHILQESKELKKIGSSNSSDDLYNFLSQVSIIPFDTDKMQVLIKIDSARGRFNPSSLDENNSIVLQRYLSQYGVNSQYFEILADNFGGIKEDNSYNSRIFERYPSLFREYIASLKHLKIINDFYKQEYRDNSLSRVDFKNLFYFGKERGSFIDLNYATAEVWEMMLGSTKERAKELRLGGGTYSNKEDIGLKDSELQSLALFQTDCFEPILLVDIEIYEEKNYAHISFEYDIRTQRGSNFVYEI
jgi:hypothetical protein